MNLVFGSLAPEHPQDTNYPFPIGGLGIKNAT
jgi:hypothetical protein